jgi:hypothetical protein
MERDVGIMMPRTQPMVNEAQPLRANQVQGSADYDILREISFVENNVSLSRDAVWEGDYLVQSKLPDPRSPKTILEVYKKNPGEKPTLLATDTFEGAYSIMHFDKRKNRIVLATSNSGRYMSIATFIIYDLVQQKIVSSYQVPFEVDVHGAG